VTEAFEKAKKSLSVRNVSLRESFVTLNEELDINNFENIKSEIQTFRGVNKVKEVSLQKNEVESFEYHFLYSCGIRLLNEKYLENAESENEDDDSNVLVEIRATFDAKYSADKKVSQELLEAFSDENVGYHVWPYWRELVQSSCTRLNIAPLETPMYYCSLPK